MQHLGRAAGLGLTDLQGADQGQAQEVLIEGASLFGIAAILVAAMFWLVTT